MQIKKTKELFMLASFVDMKPEELSGKIIKEFKDAGLIYDDDEPMQVDDIVTNNDVSPLQLAVKCLSIGNKRGVLKAFLGLELIGNGDCLICGGIMEPFDSGIFKVYGRQTAWHAYKCNRCGFIDSDEPKFE